MIKALKPKIADAGRIKIGMNVPIEGKDATRPQKLDEFRVTTMDKVAHNNLAEDRQLMWRLRYYNADESTQEKVRAAPTQEEKKTLLKAVKVRVVPILFHSDDVDDILRTEYVSYQGPSARYKQCDGETCYKYEIKRQGGVLVQTGRRTKIACECPKSPHNQLVSPRYRDEKNPAHQHVCKPHGEFRCLINLPGAAKVGALYTFRTHGYGSIRSIMGSLDDIRSVCHNRLVNVPCLLVMHPGHGKDARGRKTSHWEVHVQMDVELIEALEQIRRVQEMKNALGDVGEVKQIGEASPDELDPKEQERVHAEFFPTTEDGDEYDPETGEILNDDIVEGDFEEKDDGDGSAPAEPEPEPDRDAPVAKDDERWGKIAERFRKICSLEKIDSQEQEGERDTRWRSLCHAALGTTLNSRPTPSQADKIIEQLEATLIDLETPDPTPEEATG